MVIYFIVQTSTLLRVKEGTVINEAQAIGINQNFPGHTGMYGHFNYIKLNSKLRSVPLKKKNQTLLITIVLLSIVYISS